MAKKTAKKSGKTLGKKAMKKTKGGLTLNGAIGGRSQIGGGTFITGNLNGDGKIMVNGGSYTGTT